MRTIRTSVPRSDAQNGIMSIAFRPTGNAPATGIRRTIESGADAGLQEGPWRIIAPAMSSGQGSRSAFVASVWLCGCGSRRASGSSGKPDLIKRAPLDIAPPASHYVDIGARVSGILGDVPLRGKPVVQYNVSLLMREPIGSRRQFQVDEQFSPIEGEDLAVAVRGPVRLLRTDRGILAIAEFRSKADGECARCLRRVRYPMTLQIEQEFLPRLDPVTGGPLPEPADPDAFLIDTHHVLDLTEVARQTWLVVLPMQVLCREDCSGLCPECGADRNAGDCACEQGPIDIRWAALVRLRGIDSDHLKEN